MLLFFFSKNYFSLYSSSSPTRFDQFSGHDLPAAGVSRQLSFYEVRIQPHAQPPSPNPQPGGPGYLSLSSTLLKTFPFGTGGPNGSEALLRVTC
jgi:hypothetical protein